MFSSAQLTRRASCSVATVVLLINYGREQHHYMYSNLPFIIIPILGVASNVLLLVAFIKDPLKCFRNISCNEPVSFRLPHTFIRSIFHQQGNNRLAAPDFWISRSVVQAFLSCIHNFNID